MNLLGGIPIYLSPAIPWMDACRMNGALFLGTAYTITSLKYPYKNKHKAKLARLRGKTKKPTRITRHKHKTMDDWKPLIDAGIKKANEK